MEIDVKWHKNVLDFLRKLDTVALKRIMKKMKDIRLNPERYAFFLVNMNLSKIRIGEYRIFANYYQSDRKLIIHSIKHRKNSYKK